jgi:hypothetical protein
MIRSRVAALVGAVMLAGCDPDAASVAVTPSGQERRVCEIYGDVGGGPDFTLAYWVKDFNEPKEVAKIEARNAEYAGNQYIKPDTPQSRAEGQFAYGREKNEKARNVVSLRLAISLREVSEALLKCPGAATIDKEPEAAPAPAQSAATLTSKEKCETDAWDSARKVPAGQFAAAVARAEERAGRCRAEEAAVTAKP